MWEKLKSQQMWLVWKSLYTYTKEHYEDGTYACEEQEMFTRAQLKSRLLFNLQRGGFPILKNLIFPH